MCVRTEYRTSHLKATISSHPQKSTIPVGYTSEL